jgi:phage repressor protein C with HTH and peptisase S24 domain
MRPEQVQAYRVERLAAALEQKFEGNRSELGRALGHRDGAFVRQMLAGTRPITEKTVLAIEALPGMAGWFDPPRRQRPAPPVAVSPTSAEDATDDEVIAVPEVDVHFSAGNGHEATYEVQNNSEPAYYRRSWFISERINPKHARRFRVSGDSMETTMYHGDHVLVNMAETDVVDGKVYALRYGTSLRIKRLFRHLDGTLVLRSDNPRYAEETVASDLVHEHITIIGRVRDRSGSGGL